MLDLGSGVNGCGMRLQSLQTVAHFHVGDLHDALHQDLSVGVETWATFEWLCQQIEQLRFGGSAGHGRFFGMTTDSATF